MLFRCVAMRAITPVPLAMLGAVGQPGLWHRALASWKAVCIPQMKHCSVYTASYCALLHMEQ